MLDGLPAVFDWQKTDRQPSCREDFMLEELIEIFGWQGGTRRQALEHARQLVSDSYKLKKIISDVFYTVTPCVSNSKTDDLWERMQDILTPGNDQQQIQPDGADKPLAG